MQLTLFSPCAVRSKFACCPWWQLRHRASISFGGCLRWIEDLGDIPAAIDVRFARLRGSLRRSRRSCHASPPAWCEDWKRIPLRPLHGRSRMSPGRQNLRARAQPDWSSRRSGSLCRSRHRPTGVHQHRKQQQKDEHTQPHSRTCIVSLVVYNEPFFMHQDHPWESPGQPLPAR